MLWLQEASPVWRKLPPFLLQELNCLITKVGPFAPGDTVAPIDETLNFFRSSIEKTGVPVLHEYRYNQAPHTSPAARIRPAMLPIWNVLLSQPWS